jgi:hypothetical protein
MAAPRVDTCYSAPSIKGTETMQKLRDTQESWLSLCFLAEQHQADALPRDGRRARPLKSLVANGLVKQHPRGNVRITKRGKDLLLADITKQLLK